MKTILIIEDDIVFSRSISNWLVKKRDENRMCGNPCECP